MVGHHLAVFDFAYEVNAYFVAETLLCVFLHFAHDAFGICLKLMDSVGVGRVEGKCDHGLLLVKVDADHSVVVCSAVGL